jgi:uncharacterized protein (TIGR03437 family)
LVPLAVSALAQTAPARPTNWRQIGNAAVDLGLADFATGQVDRVWYTQGGSSLRIRTASGSLFETSDFTSWQPLDSSTATPPVPEDSARALPEEGAQVRVSAADPSRVYAFGKFVYRSEDGGRHWQNTTGYKGVSIIGDGLRDLATSPMNADEITVADGAGVFRSLDSGRSWHGLNDNLPNLPGAHLIATPADGHGPQIQLGGGLILEWLPGERKAWTVAENPGASDELILRRDLSISFGAPVTAVALRGSYIYAGDLNGRISVSSDGGQTWLDSTDPRRGQVNAFWVDPKDPRNAIAVLASKATPGLADPLTVFHTIAAGGAGWDLVSSGLPATSVNGVTADTTSNTVYVATDGGVFFAKTSLNTLGLAPAWSSIARLPRGRVTDARLDAGETQLWIAVEGPGVFAALAPHRYSDPRVVSSADLVARAAAPGGLLSVEGARVESATAGGLPVAVLDANDAVSDLQIPFNAAGSALSLAITGPQGRREFAPIPLQATSPAIFEVDGEPLIQDADQEVMLDGMHPARSGMRVRIFASGLGRVRPDWPAGVLAPLEDTPQVVAPVVAYVDREPVTVVRAVLAPQYTGIYWVEIELPTILQYGMAELYISVNGQESNHVRLYAEPGVY